MTSTIIPMLILSLKSLETVLSFLYQCCSKQHYDKLEAGSGAINQKSSYDVDVDANDTVVSSTQDCTEVSMRHDSSISALNDDPIKPYKVNGLSFCPNV